LDQDPAFKVAEIEAKLKRIESLWARLNAIPKPKEPAPKKGKKNPKNIKIENMTFDGDSDINIEDFIHMGDQDDVDKPDFGQQNKQGNGKDPQTEE